MLHGSYVSSNQHRNQLATSPGSSDGTWTAWPFSCSVGTLPTGIYNIPCSNFRTFPLSLHEVTEAREEGGLQGELARGPWAKKHSFWPGLVVISCVAWASHIAFLTSVFSLWNKCWCDTRCLYCWTIRILNILMCFFVSPRREENLYYFLNLFRDKGPCLFLAW